MKKPPLAERALAAIARYERAAGELGAIKKGIVAELEKCPITIQAWEEFSDKSPLWDNGRVNHHLHRALNMYTCDDYDREVKLQDYEIRYELEGDGEDETLKCEHCLAAWALIERRKLARREFGQAKRLVRALGKLAIQAEPAEPERSCAAKDCRLPRVDATMFCRDHQSVKGRTRNAAPLTAERLSFMMQQDGYQQ